MRVCAIDGNPAAFQCVECGICLCRGCVKHSVGDAGIVMLCPKCGKLVRVVRESSAERSERDFCYYAATALVWPLLGRGLLVVLINAAFAGVTLPVLVLIALLSEPQGCQFAGIAIMGLGVLFLLGYLALLFLRTVQATAVGDDPSAMTPVVEHFATALVALGRVIAVLLVCTAPAAIASHLMDGFPSRFSIAVLMALGNPATAILLIMRAESSLVVRVVAGLGALLLPMSLLAVATFESIRGMNPSVVIASIVRVPCQYVCCCVLFYGLPVLISVYLATVFEEIGRYLLSMGDLANLKDLTVMAVVVYFAQWALIVYSLYVQGRVLGGLHAGNRERLGWVQS